jgi:hypothetical protein
LIDVAEFVHYLFGLFLVAPAAAHGALLDQSGLVWIPPDNGFLHVRFDAEGALAVGDV